MISAKLLQLVIDAAQDGIVVAEQEGDDNILIYVNPAFETMTGYSSTETLYQDCRFLQNGIGDAKVRTRLRAAIDNGQPAREEILNYRKDGSAFWNELSITPVFNESDQLTYFIGVQKDVTEKVQARMQIADLQKRLDSVQKELDLLRSDERLQRTL